MNCETVRSVGYGILVFNGFCLVTLILLGNDNKNVRVVMVINFLLILIFTLMVVCLNNEPSNCVK